MLRHHALRKALQLTQATEIPRESWPALEKPRITKFGQMQIVFSLLHACFYGLSLTYGGKTPYSQLPALGLSIFVLGLGIARLYLPVLIHVKLCGLFGLMIFFMGFKCLRFLLGRKNLGHPPNDEFWWLVAETVLCIAVSFCCIASAVKTLLSREVKLKLQSKSAYPGCSRHARLKRRLNRRITKSKQL